MRNLLFLVAVLLLSGCGLLSAGQNTKPAEADLSDRLSVGCYTVDLFDPYQLKQPEDGVAAADSVFIGVWKDGAWNNEWCHDLYITEVRPDGTVTLLDAYGPYKPQNREATVFKRTARISNGVLRFTAIGDARVSYRVSPDGDYLIGRRIDHAGEYDITMLRHEGLPVP